MAENSFAKNKLGLIPDDDYIIAAKVKNTPIISLNKEGYNPLEILNIIISSNYGNDISFFIYNLKKGSRTIDAKLEKDENSDKLTLGCDVAYGALHEFPRIINDEKPNKFQEKIIEKGEQKEVLSENNINISGEEITDNKSIIKNDEDGKKILLNKVEDNNKEIEEDII